MQRKTVAILLALCMVALFAVPARGAQRVKSPPPPTPSTRLQRGNDKLLLPLADQLSRARPGDRFEVVVGLMPGAGDATLTGLQSAVGAFPVAARWTQAYNGFAARLSTAQIRLLQRNPAVRQIDPDLQVHTFLDTSTRYTGAQTARTDFRVTGSHGATGYSAANVVVAVIDTGIAGP